MQIMLSILENNIDNFINQINKLSPYFNHFQIDIADGIFVPNKTIQIQDIINILSANYYLLTTNLSFDFHLMVKNYQKDIELLQSLNKTINIQNIFIHAATNPNYQLLTTNYPYFTFGLVLDPQDDVNTIAQKYNLSQMPVIQIMTVNPGFQGSPFIPDALKKIEQLWHANYKNKILIDGSVNDKTIPVILSQPFKPDVLCIGSYLTKASNLEERVRNLQLTLNHTE